MNVEQYLKNKLIDCGMHDTMAAKVMERVKAAPENEAMLHYDGHWHKPADSYPAGLLNGLWASTRQHALAWIDENVPLAWFRPMFADGQEEVEDTAAPPVWNYNQIGFSAKRPKRHSSGNRAR